MELNEARSEIKELIEVARSLRADIVHASPASHYSTHRPPKASAVASWSYPVTTEPKEEEDWPDPPPWPEPDEDLHTGMGNLKIEEQELDSTQTYYAPKDAVYPPPLIERHSQLLVSILCKGYPPYHPAHLSAISTPCSSLCRFNALSACTSLPTLGSHRGGARQTDT